jgi:4-amino-4-deoxy-L-arabinose transferase-like glycosyltransferase
MRKVSIQNAAGGVLALTLLFVVLFWRLGAPTFWDPDEAHYAQTTREMIATGDWWAPYYNEQPFFDKPVLFHQLQGAAMRLASDPELGARLVPALAALGLIIVTWWFGATLISRDAGIVAALILAANPGVFALSRYAILDTLFTLFTFGGCSCLAVAALGGRRSLQWLGYVALALGVLVKGPLALVLSGLTLLLLVALSSDLRRRLLGLRWAVGLLLIVALAAPWFVYMYVRFRQDFVNGYVLDENLRLFAASRFANQPDYRFYFQILAAGMLPWTALLVGRLVDDLRDALRGRRLDAIETMLWTWSAVIVFLFTLSTFKLDHYVFPAVPALCLLSARAWNDARPATGVGRHLIGPLLIVAGTAIASLMLVRLALPWAAAVVPLALIACGAALTMQISVRRAAPSRVPWLAIAPVLVTYAGVILYVLPALEERKVIPDIATFVAARAQSSDRVASYQLNRWTPAYRFYVGRHTTFLDDPVQATAFFDEPQPFYIVLRREALDDLVAKGAPLRILYEREGMAVTSGRALWRTPERPVRYVVATKR